MCKQLIELSEEQLRAIIKEEIKKVIVNNNNKIISIDFTSITYEQAKNQYVDYTQLHGFPNYSSTINNFSKKNNSILESSGSKSLDEVKKEIINKYFLDDWQFRIITAKNNIEIAMIIPQIYKNEQLINNDMEMMGYFNSISKNVVINGFRYIQMQFEPKYQDNIFNEVKNMGILYHSTLTINVNNIKQNGFMPSSKNNLFNYPNRIYFSKGNSDIRSLIDITIQLSKVNKQNYDDYSIIVIDTNKIPDNIRFYYNPNYQEGVFTEDSIPSNTIKNIIPFKQFIAFANSIMGNNIL